MTSAREDVQPRACDLAGDNLAQGARHQDVIVSRNNQGRRADVSKAVAGIMGEQRIDPRQHDIGWRMPGGRTRRGVRRQPGRQCQSEAQVLVGIRTHLA